MKKILINIKNNEIIFSYKTSNSSINNDLINTNIISNNELIFSDVYITQNQKLISAFLNELAIQYKVNTVTISKMDLTSLIINALDKATTIENMTIKDDESLTYTICEALIKTKHIKHINCYTLQPFMIELLDKNNITCETRSEILYMSNFMEQNNLIRYSNIYYKTNVRITLPLSLEDLKDFTDFCKINKYLKTIHINKLITTELESIIKTLIQIGKSNIKIVIHENISDVNVVNVLKDINKTYKKKYKIYLTLEYDEEYLHKNLLSQTIASMLKVCSLIISSLVILVITYIGVSNYVASIQVDAIKDNLAKVMEITNTNELLDLIEKKQEEDKNNANNEVQNPNDEKPQNPDNEPPIEPEPENKIKLITNMDLATLLSVNEDVIGELKVNNTNVDYPVVQTTDNDYYLKHNINKQNNANGWIYMDFRNNPMNLDKNNIIYGHNMYYSGVMFGTLHKTANKSWYTNPENQIITYNTLYENMSFKIFSIYRVPKTNDYLKVFFDNDNDYLEFIDMITKRSIYNFNVPVSADSKILTLSTCSNNGTKRLVIHAVLIEEKDTENPNAENLD